MFKKVCQFCKKDFECEKRKIKFCSPRCGHESKRVYPVGTNVGSLAVAKRRRNLKLLAIDYKGGKCLCCGYNKCPQALQFHHLDPTKKDFGISTTGVTRSWEKIKVELDKCVLLCANCHAEVHAGITKIELRDRAVGSLADS